MKGASLPSTSITVTASSPVTTSPPTGALFGTGTQSRTPNRSPWRDFSRALSRGRTSPTSSPCSSIFGTEFGAPASPSRNYTSLQATPSGALKNTSSGYLAVSDGEVKAPSPPSYHQAVKGGYELTLAEDFHAGFSIKMETTTWDLQMEEDWCVRLKI